MQIKRNLNISFSDTDFLSPTFDFLILLGTMKKEKQGFF